MVECPECGSTDLTSLEITDDGNRVSCDNCGNEFEVAEEDRENYTEE